MSTQIDVQSERAYSEQYNEVLEQLYDKIEGSAKAAVAFAPAEKHDGLVVIPVANVGWRFGSGTGTSKPKEQSTAQRGMGVGGTMSVTPVGCCKISANRCFRQLTEDADCWGFDRTWSDLTVWTQKNDER